MKLLVDARELAGRPTGVGRYLGELLQHWSSPEVANSHEIVLCAHRLPPPVRGLRFSTIETGEDSAGTMWEQRTLPRIVRRERPDALFCPAYTAPVLTRVPTVLTIHDVSFVSHPEWFTLREGVRRRLLTRAAARKAAAVLTDSDFSAGEISRTLAVPSSRIHVVRPGVKALRPNAIVSREPLVLFVGSIFNRRHVPELISAFGAVRLHMPGARLAIVGENRTEPREDLHRIVERMNLADAVELSDYVSDERLAELYAQARVFVFVSDYEGFGLTPLEALASGVPPVVADTDVAHETCGDAAVYVRPGDVDALAAAMLTLLTDDRERMRIGDAAPGVLARYAWERTAGETLEVILEVLRG